MAWVAFAVLAFACGAIPFGLILSRMRGMDIRKHGSGNIGATNVWRVMGARLGLLCFVLDVVKGLAPTLAAGWWMGLVRSGVEARPIATGDAWPWLGVMAAAVMGHMFTPLAGFKGGKGVATGLGAMLGVWPYLTLPAAGVFVVWVAVAAAWRYVSLASCVAAVSLPVMVVVLPRLWGVGLGLRDAVPFLAVSGLLALLVVVRHRTNIGRLLKGTENRIGKKTAPVQGPGDSHPPR